MATVMRAMRLPPPNAANSQATASNGAEASNWPSRDRNSEPVYGYHNTFHLHAQPSIPPAFPPPTYVAATSTPFVLPDSAADVLPGYQCTVRFESQLGLRCELTSPFTIASRSSSEWHDIYAILNGTQFCIYQLKQASHPNILGRSRPAVAGKLIKAYTLQHAEVGLAIDVKKSDPIPKGAIGRLIPHSARQRIFQSEPHLFEPIRQHIIRVRMETEQFLLCATSQTEMLDWVEFLTASIDIAMPIDDRSEPRRRTLPRRARRRREPVDGRSAEAATANLENNATLVRQQEVIMREFYPHLAVDSTSTTAQNPDRRQAFRDASSSMMNADPDADDLDREYALIPAASDTVEGPATTAYEADESQTPQNSYYPLLFGDTRSGARTRVQAASEATLAAVSQQTTPSISPLPEPMSRRSTPIESRVSSSAQRRWTKENRRFTPQLSLQSALRNRTRLAPTLLATSRRASDVLVAPSNPLSSNKKNASDVDRGVGTPMRRFKPDFRAHKLVPFEILPPRYDAHGFCLASKVAGVLEQVREMETTELTSSRPSGTPEQAPLGPGSQFSAPFRPGFSQRGCSETSVLSTESHATAVSVASPSLRSSASQGNALAPNVEPVAVSELAHPLDSLLRNNVGLSLSLDGADPDVDIDDAITVFAPSMGRQSSLNSNLKANATPLPTPDLSSPLKNSLSVAHVGTTSNDSDASPKAKDARAILKSTRPSFQSRFGFKKADASNAARSATGDVGHLNPGVDMATYGALFF